MPGVMLTLASTAHDPPDAARAVPVNITGMASAATSAIERRLRRMDDLLVVFAGRRNVLARYPGARPSKPPPLSAAPGPRLDSVRDGGLPRPDGAGRGRRAEQFRGPERLPLRPGRGGRARGRERRDRRGPSGRCVRRVLAGLAPGAHAAF